MKDDIPSYNELAKKRRLRAARGIWSPGMNTTLIFCVTRNNG